MDNLAQAMAVKNAGGVVIVQVERIAKAQSLPAREVQIPGIFVDAIVVAAPENHLQTYRTAYSHGFTNRIRSPEGEIPSMELNARKVIARRCAFELPVNGVVNLGIGMPEGVAAVAAEENLLTHMTLTAEPGVIGGQPASGLDFGAAVNTDAVIPQGSQFDFYDGGGLDLACLGLAQADAARQCERLALWLPACRRRRISSISPRTRELLSMLARSRPQVSRFSVSGGGVDIIQEGRARKFLETVEQITFSGARAARCGQPVLFVTERCVFELTASGLKLTEIAPGIDLERDILAQMDRPPEVDEVTQMDPRIFLDAEMDLRKDLLHIDLPDRIALDATAGVLFLNFEKMRIRTADEIKRVGRLVEARCMPLATPVDVIVNYDGFRIDEALEADWAKMVTRLDQRFYRNVSRYSGSAYMRLKLGQVFEDARPHIFETQDQARRYLQANKS